MDKRTLHTPIKIFALLIIFSFLLPAFKVGGFGMKLDLVLLFPLIFTILLIDKSVKYLPIFKKLTIVIILLFLNMLLSDSFGLYHFQHKKIIYFPTEFIQVFNRVGVFYCFFYIAYNNIIILKKFKNYCSSIFIIALVFGFLQSLDISFIKNISTFYALTDTQIRGFESVNQRGYGVAGNILTWGGLSGFMFFYFYYLSESKLIKLIGCALALINISFSVSRSAIISLGVSFVLINLIVALFLKRNIKSFLEILLVTAITLGAVFYSFINFFPERYELIMMRFSYMDEALNESGRGAQREFFINFMNRDYWNYLIGIGKPVLDSLNYMEMEPLFLLVAYVVFGFILHYLLIYFSLNRVFIIKNSKENLYKFIVGVTIFYLIFSFGFFFMRESYSGMIFWIVMGYFIGNIYLRKKEFSS